MRIALLTLVIFMAGCVSQSQPGNRYNDNFDRQEAAKTRISLGLTYLKNGSYSQAKANLDKALEFAPRMADAHAGHPGVGSYPPLPACEFSA